METWLFGWLSGHSQLFIHILSLHFQSTFDHNMQNGHIMNMWIGLSIITCLDANIVNLYSTIPMGWACALVYLLPLKKCDRNKYWIPFAGSVAAFEYCDWWWGDQQGGKTPRRPRAESSHASRQYMGNTDAGWPRNFAIIFHNSFRGCLCAF